MSRLIVISTLGITNLQSIAMVGRGEEIVVGEKGALKMSYGALEKEKKDQNRQNARLKSGHSHGGEGEARDF